MLIRTYVYTAAPIHSVAAACGPLPGIQSLLLRLVAHSPANATILVPLPKATLPSAHLLPQLEHPLLHLLRTVASGLGSAAGSSLPGEANICDGPSACTGSDGSAGAACGS